MKQSQRIRVFAGGFLGGCIIAAGIAFFRMASEENIEEAPLPAWTTTTEEISLPELILPIKKVVKTWTTEDTTEVRWLIATKNGSLWRVSADPNQAPKVNSADSLHAMGNPGIEIPALRAGLEHNEFEILDFDPIETIFTVGIDPFSPDSIEKSIRLLKKRGPYIIDAAPIPYTKNSSANFDPKLD